MAEPGERELLGRHGAAGAIGALEHLDAPARARQVRRGDSPVVAGADHDGIDDPSHSAPHFAAMPRKLAR